MEFKRRKWGWYLTLLSAPEYKIKLLYFRRDGEISMQRHDQRSELWLFLFGAGDMYTTKSRSKPECKLKGQRQHVGKFRWHQFCASRRTLVLEIQTGICKEEDIMRA